MNPYNRIVTTDTEVLRQHWRRIRTAGVVLIVLGVTVIVLPLAAALALDSLLGWVLLLGGLALSVQAFRTSRSTRFWWQMDIEVLNALVGLLLLGTRHRSRPRGHLSRGKRHRIVGLEPLGTVGVRADRTQSRGRRMNVLVEARRILHRQHYRVRLHALGRAIEV